MDEGRIEMQNGEVVALGLEEPPALDVVVPAVTDRVREIRETARMFAARHGVLRPEDVALAVAEAAANAVRHAYLDRAAGPMRLCCRCRPGLVTFVVSDEGEGLVPRPDSPGLGLGLPIMAQLADEFEISDRGHTGTSVRMGFASSAHVVH
jgi:anti-sigma regulatory factor (Ser/Thr protein kinase)